MRLRGHTAFKLGVSSQDASVQNIDTSAFSSRAVIDVRGISRVGVGDTTKTPRRVSFAEPVHGMDFSILLDILDLNGSEKKLQQ